MIDTKTTAAFRASAVQKSRSRGEKRKLNRHDVARAGREARGSTPPHRFSSPNERATSRSARRTDSQRAERSAVAANQTGSSILEPRPALAEQAHPKQNVGARSAAVVNRFAVPFFRGCQSRIQVSHTYPNATGRTTILLKRQHVALSKRLAIAENKGGKKKGSQSGTCDTTW